MVKSANKDTTSNNLRNELCAHMIQYKAHYLPYVDDAQTANFTQVPNHDKFTTEIEHLQQPGHWKGSICDCLPLAVANLYRMRVQVFSSNTITNVLNFTPDLCTPVTDDILFLAYTAIRGTEHYDAVIPCNTANESVQCEKQTQDHATSNCSRHHDETSCNKNSSSIPSSPKVTPHKSSLQKSGQEFVEPKEEKKPWKMEEKCVKIKA